MGLRDRQVWDKVWDKLHLNLPVKAKDKLKGPEEEAELRANLELVAEHLEKAQSGGDAACPSSAADPTVDFATLLEEERQRAAAQHASAIEERQRLTLRALEEKRSEAEMRRKVTLLLRGDPLRRVITRLEQQISEGLVRAAPSANLVADVGVRGNLLDLLCCYNPAWLRLGVEAVSGEMCPAGSAADDVGTVRRFIDRRVLQPPPLANTQRQDANDGCLRAPLRFQFSGPDGGSHKPTHGS